MVVVPGVVAMVVEVVRGVAEAAAPGGAVREVVEAGDEFLHLIENHRHKQKRLSDKG